MGGHAPSAKLPEFAAPPPTIDPRATGEPRDVAPKSRRYIIQKAAVGPSAACPPQPPKLGSPVPTRSKCTSSLNTLSEGFFDE